MKRVLIIGGGFAGCCVADHLKGAGFDITVLESEAVAGGGCRTFSYGGHPFTNGPRHFITKDEELYRYLDEIVPLRRIDKEHKNLTFSIEDTGFFNFPIHEDDVEKMEDRDQVYRELENRRDVSEAKDFEEYVVGSLGQTIYRKFFDNYSRKMWQVDSNKELDGFSWGLRASYSKGMSLKTGNSASWDDYLSAFPYAEDGYNRYFDYCLEGVKVRLNTTIEEYDIDNYRVKIEGEWSSWDIIISTISPEILMNNRFGELRWKGRKFHKLVLPVKELLPENTYFLYYPDDSVFTRIVEYKKFYRYDSSTTLVVLEEPSDCNKLYPYPIQREQEKAKKYIDGLPDKVFSIGRMGSYRYLKLDDIILQSRSVLEKIK